MLQGTKAIDHRCFPCLQRAWDLTEDRVIKNCHKTQNGTLYVIFIQIFDKQACACCYCVPAGTLISIPPLPKRSLRDHNFHCSIQVTGNQREVKQIDCSGI